MQVNKQLILDRNNLLIWDRASYCGKYSINWPEGFWALQLQSSAISLHDVSGGKQHFLTYSSKTQRLLNNIKIWAGYGKCATSLFIKSLCHLFCCVYWTIIILIHSTTFRVPCLKQCVRMVLQNGLVVFGMTHPSSTIVGLGNALILQSKPSLIHPWALLFTGHATVPASLGLLHTTLPGKTVKVDSSNNYSCFTLSTTQGFQWWHHSDRGLAQVTKGLAIYHKYMVWLGLAL